VPTLADLGFALIKMYFEDHDPRTSTLFWPTGR